jgi:hypothetical protein
MRFDASKPAIDRSGRTWNKPLAMNNVLALVTMLRAAAAAPASYYYPREAGTG